MLWWTVTTGSSKSRRNKNKQVTTLQYVQPLNYCKLMPWTMMQASTDGGAMSAYEQTQ